MNRHLLELASRTLGDAARRQDQDSLSIEGRLRELSFNLWWNWHPQVLEMFRELDHAGWIETNHNPIALLKRFKPGEVARRAAELSLENRISFHYRRLQEYLGSEISWCSVQAGALRVTPIAYFSAEFGLHESLPLYSGGLGVLAGDYLKSASDLGLPVVGIGLFYANGYFRQRLDPSGWQQEEYGLTDVERLPMRRPVGPDGAQITIQVPCNGEMLHAGLWIARVGRVLLLLLDSDVDANPPHLRELTARLYGGDQVTRIRQEILLGIGGLRALRALDIRPAVLHLNEGHSAFAVFERSRERVEEDGLSFDDALRETALQTVFTTHTPVAAGHDRFDAGLMDRELGWLRTALRIDSNRFLGLGRVNPGDHGETFCMTVLALRGSRHRNGVSSLHGHVARRMWQCVWPARDEEAVPIGHITNGVHVRSWLALSMNRLYDRYLGVDWPSRQSECSTWAALAGIDDTELWETHSVLRRYLIDFVCRRSGRPDLLNPYALTIGCARRFATYKRGTIVLTDLERLARIVSNAAGPVQIVFAGKAHPKDDPGKRLIQQIVQITRDSRFAGRIAFVEDYDINVARYLVQGVDVWLNTPLRPLEACGTSGQKVVLNGGLNLSVLDGWWAEAYDGHNGFAIGTGNVHANPDVQWRRDATSLYDTIEQDLVPLFFDRDPSGVPHRWVTYMKRSIMSLAWRYNADRMVTDYVNQSYVPAAGGLCSE
ncbi:MAG TPA: alpha-glucan family phosphorylase [Vicinamibacterales bacterium]|jgi:starch phosphorylase